MGRKLVWTALDRRHCKKRGRNTLVSGFTMNWIRKISHILALQHRYIAETMTQAASIEQLQPDRFSFIPYLALEVKLHEKH